MIEFYFDPGGIGEVQSIGQCWLSNQLPHVIRGLKRGVVLDEAGVKDSGLSELHDREWRVDHDPDARLLQLILKPWTP